MSKLFALNNYFNRDNAVNAITGAPGAASSLTIAGWYYAHAFGNVQQPISMGTNDFDFLIVVEVDTGGNVRAYVSKGSTAQTHNTASTALSTGTWYHLAATWDGATIRLYVNGAETANTAGTITAQQAVTYLEMGYVGAGADTMTMQDVAYWGAALSAGQIEQIARQRLPRVRTGLVAYFPLFAVTGNALDYSGNNNQGIQNGTVAAGTVDAPVVWNTTPSRIIVAPSSSVQIIGSGETVAAGAGVLTAAAALIGSSEVVARGSAAVSKSASLAAAGNTRSAGSAALSVARSLTGSGATRSGGAAATTKAAAISGSGETVAAGQGQLSYAGSGGGGAGKRTVVGGRRGEGRRRIRW